MNKKEKKQKENHDKFISKWDLQTNFSFEDQFCGEQKILLDYFRYY